MTPFDPEFIAVARLLVFKEERSSGFLMDRRAKWTVSIETDDIGWWVRQYGGVYQ